MEAYCVAHTVGDEGLFAGAVHADGPAANLSAAPGAQGLIQSVLLVAEAAADVGLYYADIRPGAAQGLAHYAADYVGYLGGGNHHYAAVFLVGIAAVVFNVAVLNHGSVIPALYLDEAGFLNGFIVVALAHGGVLEYVVGVCVVDEGSALLHGLNGVQYKGKFLVFHLEGTDGLHGGNFVLCDYGGDIVAIVANVLI